MQKVRRGATALGALLAGLLLFRCPLALAWDGALDVSQYAHTAWTVRDGFTRSAISSVAQTPDGYLWLGTEIGLYRFDGVRAVPWQPTPGEQLPSSYIRNLLVAHDGRLWIATEKGLASWKDGKLTNYREMAGYGIMPLLEDHEGTIWVGVDSPPGMLCAIQGGKVQCYGPGSFGGGVYALYEDPKESLWVSGAAAGIWRWKPGPPEHYPLPGDLSADALIDGDNGTLLLATLKGLKQFVGGKIESYSAPGLTGRFRPNRFLRSRDGSLWISSQQGLLHLHEGKTDTFGPGDGLSGDFVATIFEDREGSIWVATVSGLDRFREYAVPRISRNQGLSNEAAWSVQATQDGSIWIGTASGLNRWQKMHMTAYGMRRATGPGGRRYGQELNVSGTVTDTENTGLEGTPRSLGLDDHGHLWVSTDDGVFYSKGGLFIRVPNLAGGGIYAVAGDGHGNVWISGDAGLSYVVLGGSVEAIPWSRLGHKGFGAGALLPDRAQGGLWLGFHEGGLFYVKDGQVRTSYTAADGLGSGRVNQLRFGSRGTLWGATEGGLSRVRDGHVVTLTSKNGLPCDTVHWSIEDDDHFVWVLQPCGLVRIARSELDAWVSDPSRKLKLAIFDNSDGVRSVGYYGGYGPHVTKSPDGKIWFVHPDGVSVIDPRHLPSNKLPPPVHIEQIMADRKTYYDSGSAPKADVNSRLGLPALIRDLEIDYTALSLVIPEKVIFRYKLEGFDKDWHEAGNRRQAFYSNLPPRNYRFRVAASNNSGVWNETGTFLDFSIAPAYYQTTWFRTLCVFLFLILLSELYRLRLRQLRRQFSIGFEARVSERLRIARELHDTLLQSFQGLLLRFQAVSNEMVEGKPKQKLDSAIDLAQLAITEGRDAVQGLRATTVVTNDLAESLRCLGQGLAGDEGNPSSPRFDVAVEGGVRDLHPILRDEVYRIGGEALRNAFSHAQANHIEVEIRYGSSQLRLRIRDDGKGIARDVVEDKERPGHWGLHGMRERAKIIGGNLEVWSSVQSGTEVELTIPARSAYATSPRRHSWFSRKTSRGSTRTEASRSYD